MSKKRAGTPKFQDSLFSWLRTLFSWIQTFRRTTLVLILFLSFPFSSSLYRIHIHSHSTSSCQYICICHSVLMPAIFASSCSEDTANWRLLFGVEYVQRCLKHQVLKFLLSPRWAFLRGVSSLTNAPRTEDHSVPEMFSASRDSSCVSGSSWSGWAIVNSCLASL